MLSEGGILRLLVHTFSLCGFDLDVLGFGSVCPITDSLISRISNDAKKKNGTRPRALLRLAWRKWRPRLGIPLRIRSLSMFPWSACL